MIRVDDRYGRVRPRCPLLSVIFGDRVVSPSCPHPGGDRQCGRSWSPLDRHVHEWIGCKRFEGPLGAPLMLSRMFSALAGIFLVDFGGQARGA